MASHSHPTNAGLSRRTLLERALLLGSAVTVGGTLTAAAGAAPRRHVRARATNTLVVAGDSLGADFAPSHVFQGWIHYTAEQHLFDTLYDYPAGDISKKLVPKLAVGLPKKVPNKRQYVVQLRKGVKFHDGTPFNADAVVFNYMADLDKKNAFYDSKAIYANVNFALGFTNVEAIDDYHVRFTVNRPLGDFMAQLVAMAGFMSPTAIRKVGIDNAGLAPVGTGPYRFVEAVKGDHVTLEANPGYFLGKPKIDRLVIRAIPDYASMSAALLSGDVDVTWFANVDDVDAFKRNSNLVVADRPGVSAGYVEFNAMGANGASAFKDVRVRQAALHAIDKQKLISAGLHGFGSVGAGLNPVPSRLGYQPQLKNYYKFDKTKAKQLLAAAGGSRDVTLSVPSNLYWPLAGQVIQNDWNSVGLNTKLNVVDAAVFGGTMSQGRHDAFLWDATPTLFEPWALYNTLFNPTSALNNRSGGWVDQKFQRLLLASIAATDSGKYHSYIGQMDKILLDQAVWQANYYPRTVSIYNKRLKGFKPPSAKFAIFTQCQLA
jgi:peptide/nickel transport system substrate-binding protein